MTHKITVLSTIVSCFLGVLTLNAQYSETEIAKIYSEKPLRCMGLEDLSGSNTVPAHLKETLIVVNGKVALEFYPKNDIELLLQELQTLGLIEATIRANNSVITGLLDLNRIPEIDNCKALDVAMPAALGDLNFGLTQNQAGSAMLSDHISTTLGLTGKGIKIGIISDTFNVFDGLEERVLNGDLPGTGNPNGFENDVVILRESRIPKNFARDEGRALAELIHDIAPEAELFFYGAIDGYTVLNDAINTLADAGCDIIVDDLGYGFSPLYQDGLVANTVNTVVNNGVVYFSSAGNNSRNGFEAEYTPAEINEIGEIIDDTYSYNSGATERLMLIPPKSSLRIDLQWDNISRLSPINAASALITTDLDIFLNDAITGDQLSASNRINLFTGLPFERINYTNTTNDNIIAALTIRKGRFGNLPNRVAYVFRSTSDDFQIQTVNGNEGNGTIYGHAAAEGAITIGAMQYTLAPEFGGTPSIEDFSSYGGLPKTLNLAGEPMAIEIPNKPDLIAPDGVNNTTFGSLGKYDLENDGFRNFFGTSAAAASATAIAALLLQANPNLSPEDIKSILTDTALDMDDEATPNTFDEGFDFGSGFGLIQADKAIASVTTQPIVFRVEMIDANTQELINIIENDEVVDLADVSSDIDLRLLTANTENIITTLSGEGRLIPNEGNNNPYLVVDANNTFNKPWNATSGNYNLRWFASANNNNAKSTNTIDFSITNSNFDENSFTGTLNVQGLNLSIFPNPASRTIPVQINLANGTIVSYTLFDQLGNQIASEIGNILNTEPLNSGLYLLIAKDSKGQSHSGKVTVL